MDPYVHFMLYELQLGYAYHCEYCPVPPDGMLIIIILFFWKEKKFN